MSEDLGTCDNSQASSAALTQAHRRGESRLPWGLVPLSALLWLAAAGWFLLDVADISRAPVPQFRTMIIVASVAVPLAVWVLRPALVAQVWVRRTLLLIVAIASTGLLLIAFAACGPYSCVQNPCQAADGPIDNVDSNL
jgi:hypothetical protein